MASRVPESDAVEVPAVICAFTGHRPQNLPWGENESDERCLALKELLLRTAERLAQEGCRLFLCGMARGCDTYFAEAVLRLRDERYPEVRLAAVVPCPSQADRWPARDRARRAALLDACDEVRVLEPAYTAGCMLRRNCAMVDEADLLVTVYDGSPGGTGATVRYAEKTGKPILSLWS